MDTALVGVLTVVLRSGEHHSSDFASMGSNTLISNNTKTPLEDRETRGTRNHKSNCILPRSSSFQKIQISLSETSLSFTATSNAEVKYEANKTDPEITVLGVDEYFMNNSGLETSIGRNFTGFDIENNNYVCIVGSDFEKGLLEDINPIEKQFLFEELDLK
jgi:putative ABC transport system permease protein